jgi:hypothetical protein
MSQKFRFLGLVLVGAAAALSCATQARAASDGSLLNDKFMISVGTFLLDTKTKVSLNGSAGTSGTEVDWNKDLGLQDSDRFRVDATWRFAKRHKLRALYFNTSSSASRTLNRDITIRDTVYSVDTTLTVEASETVAELAYEYVFMIRDTFELSGTAGLHVVKFDFGASGTGSVNGGPTGQFSSNSAAATAPLPVFGVRALWEFYPLWYLDGQAQIFALKIDKYDGRLSDLRLGVTRMFGHHFGVGVGYNQFNTKVTVDDTKFDGTVKWRYGGGLLYLTGSF